MHITICNYINNGIDSHKGSNILKDNTSSAYTLNINTYV